jgi:hypothetical protein
VQVALVGEDDVLRRRVELDACAKEVLPRIVESSPTVPQISLSVSRDNDS